MSRDDLIVRRLGRQMNKTGWRFIMLLYALKIKSHEYCVSTV